ncbi:hypothetical protein R6Q59_010919 [Mikania micrantha]
MLVMHSFKFILFCVVLSLSSSNERIILQKNVSVSALLVFGDSFVDQGNNNYINTLVKGNFFPYGKDFLDEKPTGRFSNGKTLSDFLAEVLGVKDYLPASLDPLLKDKDLQTDSTIPMSVQLDMFKEYVGKLKRSIGLETTNNIITNSVVAVSAATNDLLVSLPLRRLQYDAQGYSNMLVKLYLNFTQEIYMLGVRRIVVFCTHPIGCLPAVRTLAGGFDVTDVGCCGTGELEASYLCNKRTVTCTNQSNYFFWDSLHPTERGYEIIMNSIIQDIVNTLF